MSSFRTPFHKNLYRRFLLYEFVKPVLNCRFNEFVAFTNLCVTGPSVLIIVDIFDLCLTVHFVTYSPVERRCEVPHLHGCRRPRNRCPRLAVR